MGHLVNVIGTADIGLGAHDSSVRILRHAIDVGHHHPIIGINEQSHKPSMHLIGIKFAQAHEIAQDHQALDVMGITRLLNFLNYVVDRRNPCSTLPP
jgi:hypothetical protein